MFFVIRFGSGVTLPIFLWSKRGVFKYLLAELEKGFKRNYGFAENLAIPILELKVNMRFNGDQEVLSWI